MTEINTLCSTSARSQRLLSPSPSHPGPSSFFPSPGSFPVVLCSLMYPSLRFLPVLLNIPCLGETFQQLSSSKRTRAGIQGMEYTDTSGDPDLETGSGHRSITWEVSSLAALPLQGEVGNTWMSCHSSRHFFCDPESTWSPSRSNKQLERAAAERSSLGGCVFCLQHTIWVDSGKRCKQISQRKKSCSCSILPTEKHTSWILPLSPCDCSPLPFLWLGSSSGESVGR